MDLSGMQAECGRLLGDPNNDRWTAAILLARLNIAQVEVQGYTNAVKTAETLTPTASVRTLAVNGNTMDIIRVTKTLSDGSIKPLNGINREELDFRYPDWQQWADGEPLFWFWDPDNMQINLAPKPDANNAITNGLSVWESRQPTAMVNGTDGPFDNSTEMVPYRMSIVHWTVGQCFMDDGTPEALAKSKFHKSGSMLNPGQYEKWIGRIMAELGNPEIIPDNILWQPQGGRVGTWYIPSKSAPLYW